MGLMQSCLARCLNSIFNDIYQKCYKGFPDALSKSDKVTPRPSQPTNRIEYTSYDKNRNRNEELASDLGRFSKTEDPQTKNKLGFAILRKFLNSIPFISDPEENTKCLRTITSIEGYRESDYDLGDFEYVEDDKLTGSLWNVKDWFPAAEYIVITGKKGCGKTTIALKLVIRNSQGKALWDGGPVGDGRPSAYFSLEEGPESAKNMVLANGGKTKGKDKDVFIPMKYKDKPIDLYDKAQRKVLLSAIESGKYAYVIIDYFY